MPKAVQEIYTQVILSLSPKSHEPLPQLTNRHPPDTSPQYKANVPKRV
jgi:hypothetical protein